MLVRVELDNIGALGLLPRRIGREALERFSPMPIHEITQKVTVYWSSRPMSAYEVTNLGAVQVAHIQTSRQVDDLLGNIGGMVAHSLQTFQNP